MRVSLSASVAVVVYTTVLVAAFSLSDAVAPEVMVGAVLAAASVILLTVLSVKVAYSVLLPAQSNSVGAVPEKVFSRFAPVTAPPAEPTL